MIQAPDEGRARTEEREQRLNSPAMFSLCRTVHFHHTFTRKFGCRALHC